MIESFLTFDAGASMSEAVELVGSLGPRYLIVCDLNGSMSGHGAAGPTDDDDDAYFVFDVGAMQRWGFGKTITVGAALEIATMRPADVVDFSKVGIHFRVAGDSPVVVVEDGVVQGLAEAPEGTIVPDWDLTLGFIVPDLAMGGPEAATRGGEVVSGGGGGGGGGGAWPGDAGALGGGGGGGDGGGGDGGGGGEPGGAAIVAMAVSVDYPMSVTVNDTMSLLVQLTLDPGQPDVIPVAVAPGDLIDVVVSARAGFEVVGSADAQLQATGEAESLPVQIKLRATTVGVGRITVYAFLRGTALGSLTVTPEVVEAGAATGPRLETTTTLETRPAGEADLSLLIFERRDAGGTELLFKLDASDRSLGLNLKSFGPIRLTTSPAAFFADLYTEITELPMDTERLREIAAERVAAIGSTLFEKLLPEDLQVLLWGLRERIRTVFVQSEEPWVPWELLRLQGKEGGRVVEGMYFCEAFELTRWTMGTPLVQELPFTDLAVIAPPSNLDFAKDEVAMLKALAGPSRSVEEVKPATYSKVIESLGAGTHDGIHFVGHGQFPQGGDPGRSEISLAGTQSLKASDITGKVKNLGIPKPLVFLNACEVGRQGLGLTGVGGWATAMLGAGAGAFVASHWVVSDDLAFAFSTAFYQRLVEGDTVGAATRTARLSIRDSGDPTWLAYTAFADPGARLTVRP